MALYSSSEVACLHLHQTTHREYLWIIVLHAVCVLCCSVGTLEIIVWEWRSVSYFNIHRLVQGTQVIVISQRCEVLICMIYIYEMSVGADLINHFSQTWTHLLSLSVKLIWWLSMLICFPKLFLYGWNKWTAKMLGWMHSISTFISEDWFI